MTGDTCDFEEKLCAEVHYIPRGLTTKEGNEALNCVQVFYSGVAGWAALC